jgi:taurine--2-oxoglutarate transaminase
MTDESWQPEYTTAEIIELCGQHTLYEWGVQSAMRPVAVGRAEGVYFWDTEGKRYLDFNSQLMAVNIGHGDRRVIEAVRRQMEQVCYVAPTAFVTAARAEAGRLLAEVTPPNLTKSFFTNAGAGANENAIKIARAYTGRHKILSRYRSYHGATAGAITLTGDPRRWASEPGIPGVVRIPDFYPYRAGYERDDPPYTALILSMTEDIIRCEGPHTIAALIVEPVVGTNGLLIPSADYIRGLRDLCTRYGILFIADEVMSGFGRTGRWFAVEHWGVAPDIMTLAKGLTSAYVPLGATVVSAEIAEYFQNRPLSIGLTYNSHSVGCAAAVACINIYKEDRLIENAATVGETLKAELLRLQEHHPCMGDVRALGLFSLVELVKDRKVREPLVPFNATASEMAIMNEFNAFLRANGLFTFVRWNTFFVNPPLCITEAQLREGLEIIDRGLAILDAVAEG